MNPGLPFLRRTETWLCITLLIVAGIFLSYQITRPLVDYDEAIYANVVVDTMHSGDIWSFTLANHPWFEKPPIYFWSTMPLVATFGPQEWTFRLPSIVASLICLLLTYLLVRELTCSVFAAVTSFLVLLSSPWFYFFAIEARLDSGVIAAILAALLVAIKGWRDERYLIALFPLMAVGFLIKSIIILLVVPLVLIYSVAYREWRWLQNRYLWLGSLIAAGLWLPWHFLETWRFGSQFWQSYLISNLARTTSQVTGTNNIGDYVIPLMIKMPVWFWLCLTLMVGFLIISSFSRGKDHLIHRQIAAPLASALFIFAVFTAAHTHLAAYVLPAYPFLAMFVALFAYTAVPLGKKVLVIPLLALFLIISGAYYCLSIPWTSFQDEARFANDEMLIGKYYRANHSTVPEALYSLQWDGLDAINFYSGTKIIYTTARSAQLTEMTPPFFLVATTEYLNMLYKQVPQQFNQFKIVYVGTYLVMLYSQQPFSVGGPSK